MNGHRCIGAEIEHKQMKSHSWLVEELYICMGLPPGNIFSQMKDANMEQAEVSQDTVKEASNQAKLIGEHTKMYRSMNSLVKTKRHFDQMRLLLEHAWVC